MERGPVAVVRLIAMCCLACTASPVAAPARAPEPVTRGPADTDSSAQQVAGAPSAATPAPAATVQPPSEHGLGVTTSRRGVLPPPQHPDYRHVSRDVRVARVDDLSPRWETACDAFAGEPCTLRGDFDGDGRLDQALKIRETSTKHAGIAVVWADASVSLIAADSETAIIALDFDFVDGFDRAPLYELSWDYGLDDLAFLEGWRLMSDLTGPRLGSDDPGRIPVPAALGDGIRFHGRVLFYDGHGWRLLVLV